MVAVLIGSIVGTGSRDIRKQLDGCPEIIQAYFGDRSPQACRVAWCESRWDQFAVSPGGHIGYFQISQGWGWRASFDADINVGFAYELSKGGYDWSHWSCKP